MKTFAKNPRSVFLANLKGLVGKYRVSVTGHFVWCPSDAQPLGIPPKVSSHFSLQLVSQDSAQELFRRTISPYLGVSRIEFQFCCLWTPFVSQGVDCLHSVGFGGSWTFTVIFLNVSRGSSLFVSLYISFV